jgi:hypothetical protein
MLREALKLALEEKKAVLGSPQIVTVGSVSTGARDPNDIDLKVSITKSLLESAVEEAAKEAVRFVIWNHCFDGQKARLVVKERIWQWPLDVSISDGTMCLYLKPITCNKAEATFELLPV